MTVLCLSYCIRSQSGLSLILGYPLQGEHPGRYGGFILLWLALVRSALGRWAQPDSLVPNPYDSQSWDRYAYVNNNAVRYTNPSGHMLIGYALCLRYPDC